MWQPHHEPMNNLPFILASASQSRQQLLHNAGLDFETCPSSIGEEATKDLFLKDNEQPDLADLAVLLAGTKASAVSQDHPDRLVIGADQVLIFEQALLNKPTSMEVARDQLLRLRGRTHTLQSAVSCALNDEIIWTYSDSAHLTMRQFTPQFLGRYLAEIGKDALTTVGSYKLERQGIQLFDRVEGDYFTILGLPLLPLLSFLRERGEIAI